MASSEAYTAFLHQVLEEYGGRLDIHGESHVLVSDIAIAKALYNETEAVRTPFGPRMTVASQPQAPIDASQVQDIPNAQVEKVDDLQMDFFTHAIFGVASQDPKYIFHGLKQTKYSLKPKGYALVISLKQESQKDADGNYTVSLEDKMQYQSRGKVKTLSDVLEFAGFEQSRIKTFEKSAQVGGKEVNAEVLLSQHWDQLTA